jgi:transcriptional regulator with GAF, ATPase, and Fis domain
MLQAPPESTAATEEVAPELEVDLDLGTGVEAPALLQTDPTLAISALAPPAAPALDTRSADLAREICDAVTAEVEPARVLDAALRPIAAALSAAPVALYLRDADTGELVREAECDGGGRRSDRAQLSAARGLAGSVLATGQLVATGDPTRDPRFDAACDTPADGAVGPLVCGALRFRGKPIGIFRAFPASAEHATPELGELLAAALSAAVRNVLLYRSLVQTIEEVAEARRTARETPSA